MIEYTIKITKDGNQWCALFGENLQTGYVGFSVTVSGALKALVENEDFVNLPLEWPDENTMKEGE